MTGSDHGAAAVFKDLRFMMSLTSYVKVSALYPNCALQLSLGEDCSYIDLPITASSATLSVLDKADQL